MTFNTKTKVSSKNTVTKKVAPKLKSTNSSSRKVSTQFRPQSK
jgi:hypothetical protein